MADPTYYDYFTLLLNFGRSLEKWKFTVLSIYLLLDDRLFIVDVSMGIYWDFSGFTVKKEKKKIRKQYVMIENANCK